MEFVKPYKWKIVLTVLIGIIKFSIPLVIPLLLKYVVDDIIQGAGLLRKNIHIIHGNGGYVRHFWCFGRLSNITVSISRSGRQARCFMISGTSFCAYTKAEPQVLCEHPRRRNYFKGHQ